jgi:DNA repair protein RecO (recombination protein O)
LRSSQKIGGRENNLETSRAILLRKRKLSDTSLVVVWFAESLGYLETVARGARRPRSPFAGKLDLFFEAEIQIRWSRRSQLHTLTEAVVENPHVGIRQNFLRTQAASYFVELIELSTEPEHPAPELFHLLQRAFGFLDAHDATLRAVRHFEEELAQLTGVRGADARMDAAVALGALFGRLPHGRPALLKALK